MNFDPRIKTGDIIIVREFNLKGLLANLLFPKTLLDWPGKKSKRSSFHNGIAGTRENEEGIFETELNNNFHFTPWGFYQKKIDSGKFEVKVIRHPLLNEKLEKELGIHLNKDFKIHPGYDVLGAVSVIIDTISGKIISRLNSRRKWYCSEIINHAYKHIGIDFFGNEFPSPYTVEKKVKDGTLIEVADFYKLSP